MQIIDPESLSVARGRGQRWSQLLDAWRLSAAEGGPLLEGSLVKAAGLALEASGCTAAIGSRCLVQSAKGEQIEAEVVGFADERIFLMPIEQVTGLTVINLPKLEEFYIGLRLEA